VVNACGFYVLWPLFRKHLKKANNPEGLQNGGGIRPDALAAAANAFERASRMALADGNEQSYITAAANLAGMVEITRAELPEAMAFPDPAWSSAVDNFHERVERNPELLQPYRAFIAQQKENFEKNDTRVSVQLQHPFFTAKELLHACTPGNSLVHAASTPF